MASTPISHPFEKRDVHAAAGTAPGALAAAVDPLLEASETWMQRLRELVRNADEFVRENPWRAIGAVALIGVTIGYMLSSRQSEKPVAGS